MQECDLAVIGGGLAGLTAALFGARYGLATVVVDQMAAGGQVLNVEKIENFPGFPQGIAGYELGPLVQEQAAAAGAQFSMDTVTSVEQTAEGFMVRGAAEELAARAVIVAAGSSLRSLGLPGEEALLGRGVSHCASCDGPLFSGKKVCVVGGGDSAVDEAAVLAGHARQVLLVHRGRELSAQQAGVERLRSLPNVEIQMQAEVREILGDGAVSGVTIRDLSGGNESRREVSGVFVFVGLEPNSAFLAGLVELDAAGHIATDAHLQTSVPGLFAAGDIRQASSRQLVSAAGDGATAAVSAYRFLRSPSA